jgi:hypothetical protein
MNDKIAQALKLAQDLGTWDEARWMNSSQAIVTEAFLNAVKAAARAAEKALTVPLIPMETGEIDSWITFVDPDGRRFKVVGDSVVELPKAKDWAPPSQYGSPELQAMVVARALEKDAQQSTSEESAAGLSTTLLLNGLTEAETDATASVTGLVHKQDPSDTERLDWLQENFFTEEHLDWKGSLSKESWKWVFFAPIDVQGDIRTVLDAAIARSKEPK